MQLIFSILPDNLPEKDINNAFSPAVDDVRGMQFSGQNLQKVDLRGCDVDQCRFSNYRFIQCRMENFRFGDVVFESCDLSNLQLPDCSFHRVAFRNCKLSGAVFSSSMFRDTAFQHVVAPYTNFLGSNWKNCLWRSCDFTEAFFAESIFASLVLEESRLIRADFSRSKLGCVDYRSCDIRGIHWELSQLKGSTVSYEQAVELVEAAGIIVQ